MLTYAETLMPRGKKLTGGSIPAPLHFSNFEESVLAVLSQRLRWAKRGRFAYIPGPTPLDQTLSSSRR
jgi:hypothetical protein